MTQRGREVGISKLGKHSLLDTATVIKIVLTLEGLRQREGERERIEKYL